MRIREILSERADPEVNKAAQEYFNKYSTPRADQNKFFDFLSKNSDPDTGMPFTDFARARDVYNTKNAAAQSRVATPVQSDDADYAQSSTWSKEPRTVKKAASDAWSKIKAATQSRPSQWVPPSKR
jgi:hypothetical protein